MLFFIKTWNPVLLGKIRERHKRATKHYCFPIPGPVQCRVNKHYAFTPSCLAPHGSSSKPRSEFVHSLPARLSTSEDLHCIWPCLVTDQAVKESRI